MNNLDFLRRVLPWPTDDQKGYINLHYAGATNGHPWFTGKPTTTPRQFIELMNRVQSWTNLPTDIYWCLSRQSDSRKVIDHKTNEPKVVALRSRENALALKAIWLDVDVGKYDKDGKPTCHETRDGAIEAIGNFVSAAGLPHPSAMVGSGGGLHVYWISDRELTPAEWQPYADGLKQLVFKYELFGVDAGVTTDSARVLRPPGTFNRKKDPPRPVELLELQETDYDFATTLAFVRGLGEQSAPFALPAPSLLDGAPLALFGSLPKESLGAGITHEEWIVDLDLVAPECGFIREALETGGADFNNPLWNYTTQLSQWAKGGRADAHRMARGYPKYSETETDEQFNRKVAERHGNPRLGPAGCKAIHAAGCKHCGGCPHLAADKSPLHHVRVPTAVPVRAAAVQRTDGLPGDVPARPLVSAVGTGRPVDLIDEDLPYGFVLRHGFIHKMIMKAVKGGSEEPEYKPVLQCSIHDVWAHKVGDAGHALNFTVSTDGDNFLDVSLPLEEMEGGRIASALLKRGVKIDQKHRTYLGELFLNWLSKLHAAGESRQATQLGWVQDPVTKKMTGFNYGGHTYFPDGSRGKAGIADAKTRAHYTPAGELEPWHKACKTITDQHRPGLETLVAVGFASPLMAATAGQYHAMLCCIAESGSQKTCGARTGVAVWGNPKFAKETPKSTARGALQKMGTLRNLPLLWDEIQDTLTNQKMYDTLYEAHLGVEGSRLNSDIQQQHRGDWQMMSMICTNNSFADFVAAKNPGTSAGLMRVLEWFLPAMPDDAPYKISTVDADQIFGALDNNYGLIGEQYASLLIQNWDKITEMVVEAIKEVETDMQTTPPERNWAAAIGCILIGASIANTIGCDFHINEIRGHLYEAIRQCRRRVLTEIHSPKSIDNVNEMLTTFLKAQEPFTLLTTASTLKKGAVEVAGRPDHNKPVQVEWAQATMELKISRPRFREWVAIPVDRGGAGLNARQACQSLTEVFGMTVVDKRQLGVGTTLKAGQESLLVISLDKNPGLRSILEAKLNEEKELPPGATPDNPEGTNAKK